MFYKTIFTITTVIKYFTLCKPNEALNVSYGKNPSEWRSTCKWAARKDVVAVWQTWAEDQSFSGALSRAFHVLPQAPENTHAHKQRANG